MPVSQVAVTSEPLDTDALVTLVDAEGDGAVVTFAGLVRNHNQGRRVQFLEYEAYEPLAVRALQRIVD
jgi:molybdopterin synthase catalytic subunit